MATKTINKTEEPQLSGRLTNAQREIIQLFTLDLSASEMKKLKEIMVSFMNTTIQERINKKIKAGKLSLANIDKDKHYRIKK